MGGDEIILDEASSDADFDIVFRQWEVTDKSTGIVVYTTSASTEQQHCHLENTKYTNGARQSSKHCARDQKY